MESAPSLAVLGEGGVLPSCRPGQVVVDLSISAPSSTVRLHAALAKRGFELIDVGIFGGARAAEQGTLTIMAGGSEDALRRPWVRCSNSNRQYYEPADVYRPDL